MMERKEKEYSLEEVLIHVDLTQSKYSKKKIDFDGDEIKTNSLRYKLFKSKGCDCVVCDMKGEYFVKERNLDTDPYHFNLYGMKDGVEVMMTKDHIKARANGGTDHMDNLQPMCYDCNQEKADKE